MTEPKTYTITVECRSNIEWTTTPDAITVEFTEAQLEKYKKAAAFCKEQDAFYIAFLWDIHYTLYQLADGDEPEEQIVRLKPRKADEADYIEFDSNEYSIGSTYLKIYSDESLQVVLYLKHSDEEIWASLGNIDNILKNNDRINQRV